MLADLKNFWQKLQTGMEVAVAGAVPDKLLGVRDGLLRFLHEGMNRNVSAVVVPQEMEEAPLGLMVSDEEILRLVRSRVLQLEEKLGDTYHLYVASEAGLHSLDVEGHHRYFVRYWTVVRGPLGEAWGSSGSVQMPQQIVNGLDGDQIPAMIPGTRRSGGMISSLTGGLETRRKAIALSTLHALSTLFYGTFEGRPPR
jgi:non-canonical (house-cleaning) NTP pyrophosphatase